MKVDPALLEGKTPDEKKEIIEQANGMKAISLAAIVKKGPRIVFAQNAEGKDAPTLIVLEDGNRLFMLQLWSDDTPQAVPGYIESFDITAMPDAAEMIDALKKGELG